MSVHATGEEVVHHSLLDRLIFGNQALRLLDKIVQRRQNQGDFSLFVRCKYWNPDFTDYRLV